MSPWWDYRLRFYYGKRAKRPKIPGRLALETVNRGARSRDMDIAAGRSRPEIGRIEVRDYSSEGPWTVVYAEVPGDEWAP